jgi:hypothetical protein
MDVCLRFYVLCCPVCVEALRRADHLSKESYQLSNRFTSKKNPRHRKVKEDDYEREKENYNELFSNDGHGEQVSVI